MVQRWSCKSKEAQAVRVRENQRRHRARSKAYVAELEKELANVRDQLEAALTTNKELLVELELFRARGVPTTLPGVGSPPSLGSTDLLAEDMDRSSQTIQTTHISNGEEPSFFDPEDAQAMSPTPLAASLSTGTPCQAEGSARQESTPPGAATSNRTPSCPLATTPVTSRTSRTALSPEDWYIGDCANLPPPAPGESTILCRTAFSIIQQQNYAEQDLSSIDRLLAPGFRRATGQEDGCRVESSRVFSVIDALTESV